MIKTLYPIFQHWSNTGSVFIISDPHFGETDMNWRFTQVLRADFTQSEQYGKIPTEDLIANFIVDNINKVCHKCDTLIILGDIGDVEYVKKLKAGYKILIKGNHDLGTKNYQKQIISNACGYPNCKMTDCDICYLNKIQTNKLFDEVYDGPVWIAEKILLSHEPIEMMQGYVYNIHGHNHNEEPIYIDPMIGIKRADYFMNVSAEKIGFTPISLGEVINSGILTNIPGIHRLTIDRATELKRWQK